MGGARYSWRRQEGGGSCLEETSESKKELGGVKTADGATARS